jgi:hypothetical protein
MKNYENIFKNAVKNKRIDKIKQLIKDGLISPDINNNWAIRYVCRNRDTDMFIFLLSYPCVDPLAYYNKVSYNNCISIACENQYTDIMAILIQDKRVNPAHGNWFLRTAAEFGLLDIIKLLEKDKIMDFSEHSNYALDIALQYEKTDCVKFLFKNEKVRKCLYSEKIELYNELKEQFFKDKINHF